MSACIWVCTALEEHLNHLDMPEDSCLNTSTAHSTPHAAAMGALWKGVNPALVVLSILSRPSASDKKRAVSAVPFAAA